MACTRGLMPLKRHHSLDEILHAVIPAAFSPSRIAYSWLLTQKLSPYSTPDAKRCTPRTMSGAEQFKTAMPEHSDPEGLARRP
jgi:hypothetical protein